MSNAVETAPQEALFEQSEARIYPEGNKTPEKGNSAPKNGNGENGQSRGFMLYGQDGKRSTSHLKRWQFTPDNAQHFSALGNKAIAESKIKPIPDKPMFDAHTRSRLRLLGEQIASTRSELNNKVLCNCPHCFKPVEMRLAAKDRAQLLNALDRLLERERILRGIAAPAPFRAPRQQRQQSSSNIEPL